MECMALKKLAFKLAILFLTDSSWKSIDSEVQKNEPMASRSTATGDDIRG